MLQSIHLSTNFFLGSLVHRIHQRTENEKKVATSNTRKSVSSQISKYSEVGLKNSDAPPFFNFSEVGYLMKHPSTTARSFRFQSFPLTI